MNASSLSIALPSVRAAQSLDSCRIYVLDPARDLGMPGCDFEDPKIWPFNRDDSKLEASGALLHNQYQHAVQHWIAKAVEDSPYAARSLEEAQLVFVNLHCYATWHVGKWWEQKVGPSSAETSASPANESASEEAGASGSGAEEAGASGAASDNSDEAEGVEPEAPPPPPPPASGPLPSHEQRGHPDELTMRAMGLIREMEFYKASNGTRLAVAPFWPGYPAAMMRQLRPCDREPYVLTSEHAMFCPGRASSALLNRGQLIPHVASKHLELDRPYPGRDIFLFYRGSCSPMGEIRLNRSSGKMMRSYFMAGLPEPLPADVDAGCSCGMCETALAHDEAMARMRRSVFCPVMAGDTQSSRRLAEVVLAGCIPVFVGPPYHTLSMPLDVDYASIGIFVDVAHRPWIIQDKKGQRKSKSNSPRMMYIWALDAALAPGTMQRIGKIDELHGFLRNLPASVLRAKQAALEREKYKLYYDAPPGKDRSVLGEIVVRHMCEYAQTLEPRAAV
ncbi:hypothetical protein H632_c623p1 [Helicosporidium sp. ATCC 50920]|nr:hypothetical protein H632_c623p1 [Helicosporidium sp. ATCC 50920]|eukprot:KDD75549.1 hypothetical protein H632_c623p1 [Helicosporidium sp. ATCC 50920]